MTSSKKRLIFYSLLALFLTLFTLIALETGTRILLAFFYPDMKQRVVQHQAIIQRSYGKKPVFAEHPYLTYIPADVQLQADGCIIGKNKFLFQKPDNTVRIACLGSSTTKGAYPKYLQNALEPCFPGMNIEVMDWGCQGWTIIETTLNYLLRVRLFEPDVVIVHEGINDIAPRMRLSYLPDYSHYRQPFSFTQFTIIQRLSGHSSFLAWTQLLNKNRAVDLDRWTIKKVPAEDHVGKDQLPGNESLAAYQNCLNTFYALANADNAQLIFLGMVYQPKNGFTNRYAEVVKEHNHITKQFADEQQVTYVDAQRYFQHRVDQFMDHCHLTSYGDRIKANQVSSAIAKVLNHTPRVWVTDNLNSTDDLSGKTDLDADVERELVIHWQNNEPDLRETHIWVQVDGQTPTFLGVGDNLETNAYVWNPRKTKIDPAFRNGPQFGHEYSFSVWSISNTDKVYPGYQITAPVRFEEAQ